VLGLLHLVGGGVETSRGATGERGVANVALGLLLVGFLGGLSSVALDGLGDVVGGVLDRVDGLADDAVVWLVNVWCRHVDCWWFGWLFEWLEECLIDEEGCELCV